MFRKITLLFVVSLTLQVTSFSQQLPLYSQYMFNQFLINPAAAGQDGFTSINLTAREQWVGMANSPKTHSISAQTRLLKGVFILSKEAIRKYTSQAARDSRVGLGINIYNDKTGIIDRTGFQFTYAYHLLMDEAELSFGLSASFYQFTINKNKIKLLDPDDKLIDNTDLRMFMPDVNFGVQYTAKRYYYGFAINQLTQSSVQFGNSGYDQYRLYRHYFLTGGYQHVINRDYILEPTCLIKISKQARPQIDLGTKLYIQNEYWAGLAFRTGSAFVIMAGLALDKYHFGYSFDYNLKSISKHSFGSHEFMIAVKFGDNARRFRWLRRFNS
jgi:type IX secretion system PorP/SprF family membrane protein